MHKGLAWWEALPHASRAESAGSLDAGPRCLGSLTRIWHGTPPRMLNNRREAFRRIGHVRMAHAMWSSEHPTCLPPAYSDTQSIQLSGFKGDDFAALTEGNAIDTHPAPGSVKPTQCVRRIPLQSSSQVSSVHTSEPRAAIIIPRHKKNSLTSFPRRPSRHVRVQRGLQAPRWIIVADSSFLPLVYEIAEAAPRSNIFALMIVSHLLVQPRRDHAHSAACDTASPFPTPDPASFPRNSVPFPPPPHCPSSRLRLSPTVHRGVQPSTSCIAGVRGG